METSNERDPWQTDEGPRYVQRRDSSAYSPQCKKFRGEFEKH